MPFNDSEEAIANLKEKVLALQGKKPRPSAEEVVTEIEKWAGTHFTGSADDNKKLNDVIGEFEGTTTDQFLTGEFRNAVQYLGMLLVKKFGFSSEMALFQEQGPELTELQEKEKKVIPFKDKYEATSSLNEIVLALRANKPSLSAEEVATEIEKWARTHFTEQDIILTILTHAVDEERITKASKTFKFTEEAAKYLGDLAKDRPTIFSDCLNNIFKGVKAKVVPVDKDAEEEEALRQEQDNYKARLTELDKLEKEQSESPVINLSRDQLQQMKNDLLANQKKFNDNRLSELHMLYRVCPLSRLSAFSTQIKITRENIQILQDIEDKIEKIELLIKAREINIDSIKTMDSINKSYKDLNGGSPLRRQLINFTRSSAREPQIIMMENIIRLVLEGDLSDIKKVAVIVGMLEGMKSVIGDPLFKSRLRTVIDSTIYNVSSAIPEIRKEEFNKLNPIEEFHNYAMGNHRINEWIVKHQLKSSIETQYINLLEKTKTPLPLENKQKSEYKL